MMDIATGFGLPLLDGYAPEQFWVPLSYERVRVYGKLPRDVVAWIRSNPANSASGKTSHFDVTIAAPDGSVLVEVEGFTLHRLTDSSAFTSPPASAKSGPGRELSPAERRLRQIVMQGIPSADGAEMFLRAMASPQTELLVSSLDLNGMIAQVERDAAVRPDRDSGFERPDLDSDYVAPSNVIESKLAEFWSELLGISQIGVEDNFFDLGGHSLIAVRLFAKVKATFSVDFPISILFEAPTIRKCAEMIAEQVDRDEKSDADAPAATVLPERKHLHLVPMNENSNKARTPFFMVAGMFGNVLNLRHLAHLLGPDRAFYGLQARGLYGGAKPHDDLVEAARDYLAEIRQVQPRGPYLIGGFSGGGITAYEMARQLKEAGEAVAALIMLDTPLPRPRALTRQDRMMLQLLRFREKGVTYPIEWARRRILWEIERRKAVEFEVSTDEFHNAEIRAGFLSAVGKYQVQPWDGKITLFRPPLSKRYQVAPGRYVNEDREYEDPANEWDQYAPNLEIFEVPGDHDSMVLEPNVRVLAARIRTVLQKADSDRVTDDHGALRAAE